MTVEVQAQRTAVNLLLILRSLLPSVHSRLGQWLTE
jgi:hypothetical protein